MIERDFVLNDGRTLSFHAYSESIIDIPNGKIKYLTRSFETESAIDYVVLYVESTFSEWSPELLDYDTAIEAVTNGELKQYGIVEPVEKTFAELQTEKSNEISSACRAQIYEGYDSDALGAVHHYPAKDRDQSNMIASVTDSYNPDNAPDWTTLFWCMDGSGAWALRPHTASEIRKAGSDGKLSISNATVKNAQLQQLILAATTVAELDAITWHNPPI